MSQQNSKPNVGGVIVLVIMVVLFIAMLGSCFGSSGSSSYSSSSSTRTCGYCKREFSDATNKNYILHTNMCRNCYRNYCWGIGETPTNYDK